jgi:hypothetical protein
MQNNKLKIKSEKRVFKTNTKNNNLIPSDIDLIKCKQNYLI